MKKPLNRFFLLETIPLKNEYDGHKNRYDFKDSLNRR